MAAATVDSGGGGASKACLNDYHIMKKIGSGSYGAAFLVLHKRDKEQYVLKKVRLDNVGTKERAAAFQEVHLLSGLRHPCILKYHAHFTHLKSLCLVTDYCSGGDLYEYLKSRKRRIDEDLVIEWLVQIALALEFLHAKKIMHRDLKTQNVFLMKQGTLCLGDFGISRVLASHREMAKTVIGTPYYMSPEIMESKPYDFKSDMWALGCVIYEVMSLRHAFDADDMNGLVMKIVRGKPVPIPSHYSKPLRDIVSKLLQKQPKQRPTAKDVLGNSFLAKSVQRWRLLCANMDKEQRHIVTDDDLDENMMMILERHRQRQQQQQQQQQPVPSQPPQDHREYAQKHKLHEQDIRPPPPRRSLDDAVNEAEERLRLIQEERNRVRIQQEELIKQKIVRKRIEYAHQQDDNNLAERRQQQQQQHEVEERRRHSYEPEKPVPSNHEKQRRRRSETPERHLAKLELEHERKPVQEDAESEAEIDFSVLSPKSRVWAKKQEANRKREQELKQARIQYFEQRKVANMKQQQQYSRSDENESATSSPYRKVEWYDEDGAEVAVDANVVEPNVVDCETMRRGDYRERSEALRKYLVEQLGDNLFEVLYEFMVENNKRSAGEVEGLKRRISDWLGKNRMHCLALVDQLVYYEEKYV